MKSTLDSNIFIHGTISNKCSELIRKEYVTNKFNIILYSVSEEYRIKLLELNRFLTIFVDELKKSKDCLKQIDSELYLGFETKFPQIYHALRNFIIENKLRKKSPFIRKAAMDILNDIRHFIKLSEGRLYPTTPQDYDAVLKAKRFQSCLKKLTTVIKNTKDRTHIALCNQYIALNLGGEDGIRFFTADKKDFIKKGNKGKIENIVNKLEIKYVEMDPANIILKI